MVPPKSCNTKRISPAKNWCFTLNNYNSSDIDDIILIGSDGSNKYVFQEEIGEEGTIHLQGLIQFGTKVRPINMFKNKTIHWEKTKNVKASILYCSKEDTRNGEIFSNMKLFKKLKLLDPSNFYQWEKDIIDYIDTEPNDRDIWWCWENIGGVGKSVFCKYLCVKKDALILSGRQADMKFGLISYLKKHKFPPELIILDIPRAQLNKVSYSGIEEVKNGLFFSTKYESEMVVYNSPHVIIFSNEEPDYEKMSANRWKVFEIINNGLQTMTPPGGEGVSGSESS